MKIVSRPDTRNRRVAAIGMFDGVHKGHLALIEFVMRQAEKLQLVPSVVTFLNHPMKVLKPSLAPKRLTTNAQRVEMLGGAGIRDVILLDFNDNLRQMKADEFLWRLKNEYGVDALVVGFNNRFGRGCVDGIEQYREIGKRLGMEIIEAPEFRLDNKKVSSSEIRKLMTAGDVEQAAGMLGYYPRFDAKVVSGQKLGRSLGFPTANLELLDDEVQLPLGGVYAVNVDLPDGTKRRGVLNIGSRPTVGDGDETFIEAHILDYEGWLYGDVLGIELLKRLRDEQQFDNLDALKRQIAADVEQARKI